MTGKLEACSGFAKDIFHKLFFESVRKFRNMKRELSLEFIIGEQRGIEYLSDRHAYLAGVLCDASRACTTNKT